MTRTMPTRQGSRAATIAQSETILVVGHGETRIIGEYLTRFFQSRGARVITSLGWDLPTKSSLCQVGVNPVESGRKTLRDLDLLIGLSSSSLSFASRLKPGGKIVLDASRTRCSSTKPGLDAILVPALAIARTAIERTSATAFAKELEGVYDAVILGTVLSTLATYPREAELRAIFRTMGQERLPTFVQATYAGYDWVQEQIVRGKSLGRRLLE